MIIIIPGHEEEFGNLFYSVESPKSHTEVKIRDEMRRGSISENAHREGGVIENHSGSKWDYIYICDYGIMMGGIWFFHSLPFRRNGIVHTLPRRRMSRKCLQGRRYLFRRNGTNTLSRRRLSRKRLQSRPYL